MNPTGKILVLAYPDTFVKMSDEWQCRVLPKLGLGTKDYIKAGHAALVLIHNEAQTAEYFDFGRYVTPIGKGRVRSARTDAELQLPFSADVVSGKLKNLEEFLIWLSTNSKKTHGEGRLLASVSEAIDYNLAKDFIVALQQRGSIRYGAFIKDGSNCSRLVTDTLLAATSDRSLKKALLRNKKFTPSGIGNVEKAASGRIYQANEGKVDFFRGSALKENLTNYFDKRVPDLSKYIIPNSIPDDAQLLTGIGSSAYFHLQQKETQFTIERYNDYGEKDFEGVFKPDNASFDSNKPYKFVYDSHCLFAHVEQGNTIFRFELSGNQFSAKGAQSLKEGMYT